MKRRSAVSAFAAVTCLWLGQATACAGPERPEASHDPQGAGDVSSSRLQAETNTGQNWLVKGGRLTGEHYSPLDQIKPENIDALGLAWAADIPSAIGLVAEPLVVDGVVYLSAPFSVVYALDALTGEQLWAFDPQVDPSVSSGASISARLNRGVAVWKGAVIVGTGDCRLVAIDAATGTKLWDVVACDSHSGVAAGGAGAGITGAPLVAADKVFIGYLGSDTGARGSIAAFEAATGKELWRFWTVPGDPNDPDHGLETEQLKLASKTWTGGWARAGGGAVWDSMHYDPVTGFVIFGTGSGMPLSTKDRGRGDNLFTNSVIALDAETGAYKWHYQTTPEDAWDYDATMPKIVTDAKFNGRTRRVVFEAGKNGFFYVLDAHTGALLSADPISKVTWASHIDLETGRPVVLQQARYWEMDAAELPVRVYPSGSGARNWEPMAYSPNTHLVYMPVTDMASAACQYGWRVCEGLDSLGYREEENIPSGLGRLVAWDPVKRRMRWSVHNTLPFNGGVLVTAGDLVFQGTGTGELNAYQAETGERIWSRKTGSSIQAAPVSYRLGGDQYVLVAVGTGGGRRIANSRRATSPDARGPARVLAFKLNGKGEIPDTVRVDVPVPKPPARTATTEWVARGGLLWTRIGCETCHGAYAGALAKTKDGRAIPDLRYSPILYDGWKAVVIDGAFAGRGMPSMAALVGLTDEDSEAIRAYVIDQAWKAYESSQAGRVDP